MDREFRGKGSRGSPTPCAFARDPKHGLRITVGTEEDMARSRVALPVHGGRSGPPERGPPPAPIGPARLSGAGRPGKSAGARPAGIPTRTDGGPAFRPEPRTDVDDRRHRPAVGLPRPRGASAKPLARRPGRWAEAAGRSGTGSLREEDAPPKRDPVDGPVEAGDTPFGGPSGVPPAPVRPARGRSLLSVAAMRALRRRTPSVPVSIRIQRPPASPARTRPSSTRLACWRRTSKRHAVDFPIPLGPRTTTISRPT